MSTRFYFYFRFRITNKPITYIWETNCRTAVGRTGFIYVQKTTHTKKQPSATTITGVDVNGAYQKPERDIKSETETVSG